MMTPEIRSDLIKHSDEYVHALMTDKEASKYMLKLYNFLAEMQPGQRMNLRLMERSCAGCSSPLANSCAAKGIGDVTISMLTIPKFVGRSFSPAPAKKDLDNCNLVLLCLWACMFGYGTYTPFFYSSCIM
ncbi:hypothetical protein DW978_10485 [Phocaeicola vulgatus]|nr:hypothetical protein DW978_10485 [Phocaeicola vulgatus]